MGFLKFGKRSGGATAEADPIRQVTDTTELFDALGEGPAVIYKHSNRCGTAFRALKEVRNFASAHPEVPVFMIDVVRDRPVSNHVAQHFDVWHESPQALVIRDDRLIWDGSHLQVTAGALERALG
ncbi:MAG: bacillithiol system redox-active protein YtxJ [Gemmatimonadota bacterium]|nr:bacillithiol system redox-active protein YtxJ [Gemmatimonadota bacterium]